MKIFVAGISYKTAPVELREQLAVQASLLKCCGCQLKIKGNLTEAVLLSTCNRVEVYGVTSKVNGNVHRLFEHLADGNADFAPYLYIKEGSEAVKHLLSVAGGLDSMVIGETEITGQVKQAYLTAHEAKLTGRVLNRVFQTALQTAKEIRTQTGIGRGATSVASVAVELTEKIFGSHFKDKTIMIVGAGKMGETSVRHLAKKGVSSVIVANRSFEKAASLAADFGGRAVRFDQVMETMVDADIVVFSTGSPDSILHREDVSAVMAARRNRPLVLVDIAVPRNIDADVQNISNVYLFDVDDLEQIVRENVRQREHELSACHEIINERTTLVLSKALPPVPRLEPMMAGANSGWAFASLSTCNS